MARLSDDQIADIRARNPIEAVAGVKLRKSGKKLVGPCPICGGKDISSRFEVEPDSMTWVCAACPDGGDVIRLVMRRDGVDFRAACERLGGGGASDPEAAARRREEAEASRAKREAEADIYREHERERLYKFWRRGRCWRGTPAEAYLERRGIFLPAGVDPRLKFSREFWFFAPVEKGRPPRVIHKGPAMLAAFTDAPGIFRGLHITWLDLAQPDGKAVIADPETGEVYPAKKMRGSKQGCRILLWPGSRAAERGTVGEGIETVLTVLASLAHTGEDLTAHEFVAAGDLGNIGGRAIETVPHPTVKKADTRGYERIWKIPGPVPDFSRPACPISPSVRVLTQLGDGDSDPLLTRYALMRGEARHAAPGRLVNTVIAPEGEDFNSWFRRMLAPVPPLDGRGELAGEGSQPLPPLSSPELQERAA